MAEVFSNSPCMLGKRVLSPHSAHGLVGQLDFSSKKRRYALGSDQGPSERHEPSAETDYNRSVSPARAGKRARPLSPMQPSHHLDSSGDLARGEAFGFAQHQQVHRHGETGALSKDKDAHELVALRAEIGILRAQVEERGNGLNVVREENARLRDGLSTYQKEAERLQSENKILKRAVAIQNTKGKELEGQLQTLQQTAVQAAEYVKRLEQMNYALSVRVQAMGNSGPNEGGVVERGYVQGDVKQMEANMA